MLQRSVYESWIDSLTERQFDAPFLMLLRAHGFYDIHFTHGAYEFGKDFIAKRMEGVVCRQYGFQSKAGNIAGGEWNSIHGQMEELASAWLVHPNYDANLPREHRLVITGALQGKAILSAKQFQERLRSREEGEFVVWDREFVLDLLEGNSPSFPIIRPPASVERLIGSVKTGQITISMLQRELDSSVEIPSSIQALRESILQLSFLVNELWCSGLIFHAVRVSQHSWRLALYWLISNCTPEAELEYNLALESSVEMGVAASRSLLTLEPVDIANRTSRNVGAWAGYPAVCIAVCEAYSFAVLRDLVKGRWESANVLALELSDFVIRNPGCWHPFSDRAAPSIMISVVALCLAGARETARVLVKEVTKWVCDLLENGLGVSSPYADPLDEVRRILGGCFDFVEIQMRKESQIAVALCDATSVFLPDLYEVIVNDFVAVDAAPTTVFAKDVVGAMFRRSDDTEKLLNLKYPEIAIGQILDHHSIQLVPRTIEVAGGPLAPLMVACLCGDRLLSDTLPRLASSAWAKCPDADSELR